LLLLDEVAAHLDPVRREALFARLAAGPAQVWMTGTEPAPFAALVDVGADVGAQGVAHWQVEAGALNRMG
jgi:DNA replication and repair protein RecF